MIPSCVLGLCHVQWFYLVLVVCMYVLPAVCTSCGVCYTSTCTNHVLFPVQVCMRGLRHAIKYLVNLEKRGSDSHLSISSSVMLPYNN